MSAQPITEMICQLSRLLLFFSTLACLATTCFSRLARDTNAERFARGLPPLRPQRLYNATRTGPYLSRRSGLPTRFLLGVYPTGSTTPFCYVGLDSPGSSAGSCVDQSNALRFTSSQPEGSFIPASLTVTSPLAFQGQVLTGEANDPDQGPGSISPLTLFNVEAVAPLGPGAQPATGTLSGSGGVSQVSYETDVFYIASDGTVSATWVNPTGSPDGPTTPLYFWLSAPGQTFVAPTPIYGSYSYADVFVQSFLPTPVTIKVIPLNT